MRGDTPPEGRAPASVLSVKVSKWSCSAPEDWAALPIKADISRLGLSGLTTDPVVFLGNAIVNIDSRRCKTKHKKKLDLSCFSFPPLSPPDWL